MRINSINFEPHQACRESFYSYQHDYVAMMEKIVSGEWDELSTYRRLILNDLWFLVYFVFAIPDANHPFVVKACRDVEEGPKSYTLDLWGREHYKSTIITKGETIQRILRNPEERIAIFSHTRPAAKAFLRSIKLTLENSTFLKQCFPNVLYEKPTKEAPKWSEDDGLIIKRSGFYNEASVEAWGLIEGMPTGKHFTHRIYDDITTIDLVRSPEQIAKVKDAFDMSDNLGTANGTHRVVGTPYHHEDTLAYIKGKKSEDGTPIYYTRLKPSLEGGKWNGRPVLLSEDRIRKLKGSPQMFKTQHLLDPTPNCTEMLNPEYLQEIKAEMVPEDIYKFMVVDPAGDSKNGRGDAWAIMVFGVEPEIDEIGASKVFILDAVISPLSDSEAVETICRLYIDAGIVQRLGVEKVGLSTTEIHVANALRKKGRHLSLENKNLVLLRPAGRNKVHRIQSALTWPLNNGKLFLSSDVPSSYRDRLRTEMEKFPYWHDDGLDAFSYLYDMMKHYRFTPMKNKLNIIRSFKNRIQVMDNMAGY